MVYHYLFKQSKSNQLSTNILKIVDVVVVRLLLWSCTYFHVVLSVEVVE